jgi:hypothetical protein
MRRRSILTFRPDLERCEERQLLSGGPSAAHAAHIVDGSGTAAGRAADSSGSQATTGTHRRGTAGIGYLAYRITNPSIHPTDLKPPFLHVLVQKAQPVPGKTYNVLYVAVRNETAQTFTAADGLTVRVPGFTGTKRVVGNAFPVLTGDEVWKPGQWAIFYIMGHEYYPMSPQVAAGFQLQAGGRSSTMVPGPSGIILRLTYEPSGFLRALDNNVLAGQGAQGGVGPPLGISDTAINRLVSAGSNRIDFAGHF